EDPRLVRGQGRYVEDIRLPGTLHMAFVRSPYPNARITSVDAAAARAAPGVRAVLVGADVTPIVRTPVANIAPDLQVPAFEPLAIEVARAVAMPVAVVVAATRDAAVDGAALVEIDYEPLPSL